MTGDGQLIGVAFAAGVLSAFAAIIVSANWRRIRAWGRRRRASWRGRVGFHVGRVHVPPNRDWSLWVNLFGLQLELNLALPPRKAKE